MSFIETITEKEKKEIITRVDSILKRYNDEIPRWRKSLSEAIVTYKLNKKGQQSMDAFVKIRLAMLDITVLFKYALTAEYEFERNLFMRLMCGQIYEFANDLPVKILGKNFREMLLILPFKDVELEKELNRIMKLLNLYKNAFIKEFHIIRNNVSSHKDIDGMNQMKIIEELDFDKITLVFGGITDWATEWGHFEMRLFKLAEKG
jgi:hypothetical protein